jgi:hypothetical protein
MFNGYNIETSRPMVYGPNLPYQTFEAISTMLRESWTGFKETFEQYRGSSITSL